MNLYQKVVLEPSKTFNNTQKHPKENEEPKLIVKENDKTNVFLNLRINFFLRFYEVLKIFKKKQTKTICRVKEIMRCM